ncbi:MAG: hypothetical protein U0869_16285 [Chloroflexota bacterium]
MSAPALIQPGPARRRAGTLLLTYGIVGVLLMGVLFVALLAAAVMGRDGFSNIDSTIDQVVSVLDSTTAALQQADTTLTNVGTSLEDTSAVVVEAVDLSKILSDGATTLSDKASTFCILGQCPLNGVEQPLADASRSLAELAVKLTAVGSSLDKNSGDVTAMGAKLGDVATSLAATRDRLANVNTQITGSVLIAIGVLLAIIAWLAVPAFAAIWVGRRWRRENAD